MGGRIAALLLGATASAAAAPRSVWDREPFTASVDELRAAAAAFRAPPGAEIVILFAEDRYVFDREGRCEHSARQVYQSLKGAGSDRFGAPWAPDLQDPPELHARVLAPDGTFHDLDPAAI